MKTKIELKMELARLVARKMELTRARVALKRIPFKDRTPEQHAEMMHLWSECSIQKEQIRYTSLAYAFVRGKRYWHVERRVHERHRAWARGIANYAEADEASVKAWLSEEPSAEERAAWELRLEAASASRRVALTERASRRTLSSMGLAT